MSYYTRYASLTTTLLKANFAQDIKGDWKKLGAGSFGDVYKGGYNTFGCVA